MDSGPSQYPLPIARALQAAESDPTHGAAWALADAITLYLGAMAVGQYSRATLVGDAEPDPTLNRSLRSLRRVLPGQWLLWSARGLAQTPGGAVERLSEWYEQRGAGPVADAYASLLSTMRGRLGYEGEYGERPEASPRDLLELVDQYRVRLKKVGEEALDEESKARVAGALAGGLRALLEAPFFADYQLYAPGERKLLMGPEPRMPMPPLTVPTGAAELATLLLYPPGEMPDFTKRPRLNEERQPLFPLDPLLVYAHCPMCDEYRVAALREVADGAPLYAGLDPACGHPVRLPVEGAEG
jgi:hypothetical protein